MWIAVSIAFACIPFALMLRRYGRNALKDALRELANPYSRAFGDIVHTDPLSQKGR
jgi:hypothetical protein